MNPLTEIQKKVYDFLLSYAQENNGVPPTIRAIAKYMGTSPNSAYSNLKAVERKGYILRVDGKILLTK